MTRVLAADVGGTKCLLAIMELEGSGFEIERQERYESAAFPGLLPVVEKFLAGGAARGKLDAACFAIAGSILDDTVLTSNLPWTIRGADLRAALGLPTLKLINDFAAIGWGIPHLGPGDLATLQEGRVVPHGPVAYLGAGTGLGEGFMVWNQLAAGYDVYPSEGGHADFAPRDDVEFAILAHLRRQLGRVSWERVVSGMGLINIYKALVAELGRFEAPAVRTAMASEDPAAVISRFALAPGGAGDATCAEALDRFIAIYGAEAGNMALRLLATGGVYVAGGIAPKIIDRLRGGAFVRAFNDKGRFADENSRIPVHVVLNTQVGLLGAAACAARALSTPSPLRG